MVGQFNSEGGDAAAEEDDDDDDDDIRNDDNSCWLLHDRRGERYPLDMMVEMEVVLLLLLLRDTVPRNDSDVTRGVVVVMALVANNAKRISLMEKGDIDGSVGRGRGGEGVVPAVVKPYRSFSFMDCGFSINDDAVIILFVAVLDTPYIAVYDVKDVRLKSLDDASRFACLTFCRMSRGLLRMTVVRFR